MLDQLNNEIQECNTTYVPILQQLMSPFIKLKHWRIIQQTLYPSHRGEQWVLSPDSITLKDLIDAHILSHLGLVKEVTQMAEVEFEEEQTL